MKKKDIIIISALILGYLILLFTFKRNLFTHSFSKESVDLYLHSQDIPYPYVSTVAIVINVITAFLAKDRDATYRG